MKKLDAEPRLQGAAAGLVEWARKVVQAINELGGVFTAGNLLKVANGGTGANTAAGARANLGAVNIAGDTMTGNLALAPAAGDPLLTLRRSSSTVSAMLLASNAGSSRWSLTLGGAGAESSTSTGGDFGINRYNNSGTYIDSPIIISRATGQVNVAGKVSASSVDASQFGGFTIQGNYADGSNYACRMIAANPNFAECLIQGYHVPGNWAGFRMLINTSSPGVIEFHQNATIWCNGVQLTSDATLKQNVEDVPPADALAQALAIPVRTYERTDDVDMSTDFGPVQRAALPRYVGVFAQDAQLQRPELVRANGHGLLSVDYSGLAALAVGAVQGLHARLEAQQQLIDQLRAELDILKGA
ncbi:hypothetical protein ABIC33_001263 [Variovorax sp. 1140]|uniref:tail fiber domain-containing protein n=1 Tax=Variovorax atrisoli TaxID=3394203 RepID=UPI0033995D3E